MLNSTLGLNDVSKLLFVRDEPPPPIKLVVADVAKPVVFDGPECFFRAQERPARGIFSEIHDVSGEGWKWAAHLPKS